MSRDDETHVTVASALTRFPDLFDPQWYRQQVSPPPAADTDLFQHFMRQGRAANLSPGPWLDPKWYWSNYPDVADADRAAIDHYVLYGEREGRLPAPHFLPRLSIQPLPQGLPPLGLTSLAWRHRRQDGDATDPAWLFEELAGARQCETQLAILTHPRLIAAIPGTHYHRKVLNVERVLDALVPDSFLMLVPHFMLGGADRVAANIANLAAELLGPDQVYVISTDRGNDESMHWFSQDVTVRRLQTTTDNRIQGAEGSRMLAQLLMNTRPRTVLNINSLMGWLAFRDFGQTLSEYMSLNVTQFCRDQMPDGGGMGGYADDYLRDTIGYLDRVILDHQQFGKDLVQDLGLLERDSRRMKVVYSPSTTEIKDLDMLRRSTTDILWVGRLVDQKRPDLVAEVAALMPDLTFHMIGGPVTARVISEYGLDLPNIVLHGPVSSMQEIEPTDYGALLFTSAYEGMPVTAVDVGAWGLPIVASQVGGLIELVSEQTGWPIPADACAKDYVQALREALDIEEGRRRGRALQEVIARRHSWEQFRAGFLDLGMIDGVPGRREG